MQPHDTEKKKKEKKKKSKYIDKEKQIMSNFLVKLPEVEK